MDRSWMSSAGRLFVIVLTAILLVATPEHPTSAQNNTPSKALANRVTEALKVASAIDIERIRVAADDGIVTLKGTVPNLLMSQEAERITSRVKGVVSIINHLQVADDQISDAAVGSYIRKTLLRNPALDHSQISTAVEEGIVTLTGNLETWQDKQLVAEEIRQVKGVRGVKNQLTVQQPEDRRPAAIASEIRERLRWDARIGTEDITVEVSGQTAVLSGSVGSLWKKRLVAARARVPGIQDVVITDLQVDPTLFTSPPGQTSPADVPDELVREAIERTLLLDPRTQPFTINVQVSDGFVTLTGSVNTLRARQAAVTDAQNTRGVKGVQNQIAIQHATGFSDELIKNEITEALLIDPYVAGSAISIEVNQGRVILQGTVDSHFERKQAERVTQRITQVVQVDNELKVAGG